MANLAQKNGIFLIRYRFQGQEYKRSLKVRERREAEAAHRTFEQTIHRLLTGQTVMPAGIEPGDYILSGGTRMAQVPSTPPPLPCLSSASLIEIYLERQQPLLALS